MIIIDGLEVSFWLLRKFYSLGYSATSYLYNTGTQPAIKARKLEELDVEQKIMLEKNLNYALSENVRLQERVKVLESIVENYENKILN